MLTATFIRAIFGRSVSQVIDTPFDGAYYPRNLFHSPDIEAANGTLKLRDSSSGRWIAYNSSGQLRERAVPRLWSVS
jgi:hypothetical protein